MNGVLLSVKNLKMYYPVRGGILLRQTGELRAVDDVSFEIKYGETLGLVGESGCGKSTVAKTLLRLYEPTAGQIVFQGRDLAKISKKEMRSLRQEMQIIFQDPAESLNTRHTVGSILEEPFVIHDKGNARQRKQWVDELLQKVGLPADSNTKYPHEFSGGQRQRIGIARAIALKPKLLICDEPVSALDVSVQSQILNLLMQLQNDLDLTLIFIAHDLAVVKHISDRIVVMYLGKIVETAGSDLIYKRPLHPYTQSLIRSIPIPDPVQRSKLATIEGDLPSAINPPSGCHFHTRCPYAKDKCRTDVPMLESASDNGEHKIACHFAGDVGLAI
ncbi:MAG: ATP-binding cassette domain-containing protein [Gammaproteobacteria bacterium]|nr:ATP-binding cassette domain-containing protein [Gammaproteobacteria bacterium]